MKTYRILPQRAVTAAAIACHLTHEGYIATWIVTDQGPCVLTECTSRALSNALRAVGL